LTYRMGDGDLHNTKAGHKTELYNKLLRVGNLANGDLSGDWFRICPTLEDVSVKANRTRLATSPSWRRPTCYLEDGNLDRLRIPGPT
jgi:hypothetical protein